MAEINRGEVAAMLWLIDNVPSQANLVVKESALIHNRTREIDYLEVSSPQVGPSEVGFSQIGASKDRSG